jgi:sugar phosphate isomerase/epimerase
MRGTGFVGQAALVPAGGAAEPVPTSRARATTPTAPATEVDRVAVIEEDYNAAMAVISRREFGGALVAGLPLAAVMRSVGLSAADMAIGVTTSSFRDLPRVTGRDNLREVLRALEAVRASHIDLAFANLEPAPPTTAPVMGGSAAYPRRVVLTPEQVAATNTEAREELRAWRLNAPVKGFETFRGMLTSARLTVRACSLAYNDSFSDDEIDRTLLQAKALGVTTVSSPLTMAMARRLVPFAQRHQVSIAIHNQVGGNTDRAIDTPALKEALALSPAFTLKFDVANVTASNRDAVAELREHRSRVSFVVVRDRLRNGGASQPFGEGDTPIRNVLALAGTPPAVPVLIEYDYVGLRSSVEELKASMAYCRSALTTTSSR